METAAENNLLFLDVLKHKLPSGTLETSVYRKATNTDIVLQYDSNSPASHKRSSVTALLAESQLSNCSNAEARNQERTTSTDISITMVTHLISSSVPYVTGTIIFSYYQRRDCPPPTWQALSYVKNVSELIAQQLSPFFFVIAH